MAKSNEETLQDVLSEQPLLVRNLQDMCRTPYFMAVKRHVVAAFQEQGEEAAVQIAEAAAYALKETMLDFGPDGT